MREYLTAHAQRADVVRPSLERIAGLDRYTLARQFRRAYRHEPDRYPHHAPAGAVARAAIARGVPLAAAAAEAGFADQSHMTRHFGQGVRDDAGALARRGRLTRGNRRQTAGV